VGIVLQPDFLVGRHLKSGALVEVMPAYRAIELGIHAVYPSRKHLTPKVRAMIEFLVEAFREPPWLSSFEELELSSGNSRPAGG
jgi:DNA-binding transcriptional LysR family regulator